MRSKWVRYQKWCVVLSSGMTLGFLQGFSLINWASLFTSFLASLFAALVAALVNAGAGTTT